MTNDQHAGNVISTPEAGRTYAYEDEPVRTVLELRARPPRYEHVDGVKVPSQEAEVWSEYVLTFERHTGHALVVTLRKRPSSNTFVQQRNRDGAGVEAEVYTTVLSFAEIVNRLLGPGCQRFEDREALPDKVKEVMRGVYS
mgnify:CR=1 FL=1